MQVWKLSESLDFMEILRTATFAFKEKWCTPSSQEENPTLNRVEKHCLLSSTRCQERLFSRHWTPDLRLRPPRWSSYDSSIIGPSEERWSQRLQNEITARLSTPRGISHEVTERYCLQSNGLAERLNLAIMDKVLLHAYRCKLDTQALTSCCTWCSAYLQ